MIKIIEYLQFFFKQRNELLAALNDDTTHQNEIKRILDSKLLKNADNIIEIDLRDILTKKSLSLLEILDKDMEVFEKFMKREEWGGSSCHPVLTLTIELKTLMFKKVYNWNLLLFIILFMVPFFTLYVVRYFYTPGYTASLPLETAYNATRCVCVFSVIYLATISIVKLVFFYESPSSDNEKGNEFWRQKDNLIEVILVLLASPTIFCFWFGTADTYKPLIVILGVISFISLICKIHSSVFPIQAMIVKRLAYSFMGYLIIPVIFIFVLKRSKTMMESLFHHEVGINLDHYNDTSSDDHDMETDEEHFTNMDDTEESFLDMMMEESLFVFEILICCIIAFLLVSKDLIKFTGPEKQDNVARMNAQNYIDISKKFNVASRNFK